jgi:iron complex transport system ATP-binding protein
MSDQPVADARGVRAGYRRADGTRHEVLRGVDLALHGAELMALVGPNGGGKTTLLRCLAGTLPPWEGSVALFGTPLAEWSRGGVARRLAVLPQTITLPEGFRVAELVAMGRTPHARRPFGSGASDADAVERAMTDADALELAERQAGELSGGEQQRVLVAMALAQEPEILLLDEPTLHLDVAHQATLLNTIERLRLRRGLAVLAVLHDLNLAAAFAPRVALLADGRIVADGSPRAVLRPDVVRDHFGLAMEEARTRAGERFLVPRRSALSAADEPFVDRTRTAS